MRKFLSSIFKRTEDEGSQNISDPELARDVLELFVKHEPGYNSAPFEGEHMDGYVKEHFRQMLDIMAIHGVVDLDGLKKAAKKEGRLQTLDENWGHALKEHLDGFFDADFWSQKPGEIKRLWEQAIPNEFKQMVIPERLDDHYVMSHLPSSLILNYAAKADELYKKNNPTPLKTQMESVVAANDESAKGGAQILQFKHVGHGIEPG